MTKRTAPATFENTLARIAGQIGWETIATIAGVSVRHARKWGDADARELLPAHLLPPLDLAFQVGGGEGAPFLELHSLLLEAAVAERFASTAVLARQTLEVIKEGGEAHGALVAVTLPGATERDFQDAAREVEENIAALTKTLPTLKARAVRVPVIGAVDPGGSTT